MKLTNFWNCYSVFLSCAKAVTKNKAPGWNTRYQSVTPWKMRNAPRADVSPQTGIQGISQWSLEDEECPPVLTCHHKPEYKVSVNDPWKMRNAPRADVSPQTGIQGISQWPLEDEECPPCWRVTTNRNTRYQSVTPWKMRNAPRADVSPQIGSTTAHVSCLGNGRNDLPRGAEMQIQLNLSDLEQAAEVAMNIRVAVVQEPK